MEGCINKHNVQTHLSTRDCILNTPKQCRNNNKIKQHADSNFPIIHRLT